MTTKFLLALGLGLLVAATSAYAFQEQQGDGAAKSAPAESADLAGQEPAPKADDKGTEVNIPGLGSLGVLPKMDFGLELLYGANEHKPVEIEPSNPAATPQPDDLTIRGTMKHSF